MKAIKSLPGYHATEDQQIIGPYKKPLHKSKDKDGYHVVRARLNGNYVTRKVHRLICEAHHGSPNAENPWALHKNDIRTDNRPENLYWGSAKDNVRDAMENIKQAKWSQWNQWGEWNKGLNNKKNKLNKDMVEMILSECSGNPIRGTKAAIARKLGISAGLVSQVLSGQKNHLLVKD